jgi:hypothetical protein
MATINDERAQLVADATKPTCASVGDSAERSGVRRPIGWWWADPVAAIAMTPFIVKKGIERIRGDQPCADCV